MFGKNEIVGKKYFNDVDHDQLLVTSMFMTLQGEGPYRGEPAFFIRLAKCNLNCTFCDTFFDAGDWMSFDYIEDKIEDTINEFYKQQKISRPDWTQHGNDKWKGMVLVLTGGEPMLQNNIYGFLERMNNIFHTTQIESNGTQITRIPKDTTLVCSPKCLERDGVAIRYLKPRPDVLKRSDCLKFVMEHNLKSPYSEIPDWAIEWHKETGREIFISPMNIYNDVPKKSKELRSTSQEINIQERSTTDEVISFWEPGLLDMPENQANHEYAAQYCMKHGFTLNLQIHLYASLA